MSIIFIGSRLVLKSIFNLSSINKQREIILYGYQNRVITLSEQSRIIKVS